MWRLPRPEGCSDSDSGPVLLAPDARGCRWRLSAPLAPDARRWQCAGLTDNWVHLTEGPSPGPSDSRQTAYGKGGMGG